MLGLDFAGDIFGQYGALSISEAPTLDGGLAIDLTDGFTLAKGDSFDILGFGSLAGDFARLRSTARPAPAGTDMWACGGGVRLKKSSAHVAGPLRARARPHSGRRGLVAHPRTIDLGDARAGLPRPRRPRLTQARGSAFARTVVAEPSATAFRRGIGRVKADRKTRGDGPQASLALDETKCKHIGENETRSHPP